MDIWEKVIFIGAVVVNVLVVVMVLLFVAMCSDVSNTYAELLKLL